MNGKNRMVEAKLKVQETVQAMGIKNPNWRNQFIRLYDEVLQAKLQLHNTACQVTDMSRLLLEERDELKKNGYVNALVSLNLLKESQENHLAQARELLVLLLNQPGKAWKLNEVLKELETWRLLQKQVLEE